MNRRSLFRLIATTSAAVGMAGVSRFALADAEGAAAPRRFIQQRWILDNLVRANTIDWDQPRSFYLATPCGVEAAPDFAIIRSRVQKLADIGPAFESTAKIGRAHV